MKYGVSRKNLLLTAGFIWVVVGINILIIGITTWLNYPHYGWWSAMGAFVIFAIFFFVIFRRLYKKHTMRISSKIHDKNCPFAFFDIRGWLIMLFMMFLGMCIRHFELLPSTFISMFYTGLSSALILTGLQFIRYAWGFKK